MSAGAGKTAQQLNVVFDYKQRLEKTLQSEKVEHQNVKQDYTDKLNEEKMKCEKNANEGKLRFSTLQQHYNLLQTQHDDFKEECSKIQREQLDSLNQLQAKLKEVQEEMKRSVVDKENSIHHIRAQKDALQTENTQLKEKLAHLLNNKQEAVRRTEYSSTQFNKVIPVGNARFVIPVEHNEQNNNENGAVLPPPSQNNNNAKVYTPKTSPKVLNAALPLNAPSATPETSNSKSSTTKKSLLLPLPYQGNFPDGVVPAPNLNVDDSRDKNYDNQKIAQQKEPDVLVKPNKDEPFDDRYKNVGDKPDDKKDELKDQFNQQADKEDQGIEVFDLPNHDNHVIVANKDSGKAKKHLDDLNADPNDPDYEGPNIDDIEEGDDGADGVNPQLPQAIRN
ncbi:Golgi integral membrane protein 4-like [Atheta coriaria]|uniref:Golgi integral membrane protein 4-like n=1 Tax=Dalotia coriaria TaxID=877792 RepID=UPI0031F46A69